MRNNVFKMGLVGLLGFSVMICFAAKRPNIVYLMADDQSTYTMVD
jgi:hypothetical protein